VGGVDMAFQRWDDEQHRVADEDGIMYANLLPCKVIYMVIISYVWCICTFAPVIPVTTTASLRRECSSRCVCRP
jgi:hypothetical protein